MKLPTLSKPRSQQGPPDRSRPLPSRFAVEDQAKLEKVCRLCRKRRRGAAAVEFAVVAPVFFILIFGMIEFGRMVMVQQVITNASREGARLSVLDGTTATDV